MILGKQIRLNRIINRKSGRHMNVAIDHTIAFGWPLKKGLTNINNTIKQAVEGRPDAITMMKGIAEKCYSPYAGIVPLVMQTTVFVPNKPEKDYQFAYVEDALRLGADAIAMTITVGEDTQGEMVSMLGNLTKEAAVFGIPVISHIYHKGRHVKDEERYSVDAVKYAARVGAEVGVDIVKTYYTGSPESFREVVKDCPVPVVAAGGPELNRMEDLFKMACGVIEAGALGLTVGRNVWQSRNPTATVRALKAIVHEDANIEDALKIVKEK